MLRRVWGLAALFSALVLPSFGATITNGVFDFSGSIYVTVPESTPVVTPGGTCPANQGCIFWADSAGNNASGYPGVLAGKVDISTAGLPNGDIPVGISGNDAANISSLSNPPEVVGGTGFAPQLFMSFNNDSITTTLSINFIAPGVFGTSGCTLPPAAAEVCTPTGSPFDFIDTSATSSSASYVFSGITSAGSTWSADFTSSFAGNSFQQVLAQLAAKGYVQDTFAAQVNLSGPTAPAPEPSTFSMIMMSLGLVGLAAFLRRQSVQSL